jgi:RNA polymerase sigma-70 factor, ECF subfamily
VTQSNGYAAWEDETSSTLVREIKVQSPTAWKRFVGLYHGLIYRWCRKAGLQPEDAADVGQEVFRAVARQICDYRHDRSGDTFRGWLRTITRDKIRDWASQQPSVRAWDLPDGDDQSDAEEVQLVFQSACLTVRREFEERTWQAFWQTAVDRLPVEDVAAGLGMSVNAVRLATSRVLTRLRQEFVGPPDSDPP